MHYFRNPLKFVPTNNRSPKVQVITRCPYNLLSTVGEARRGTVGRARGSEEETPAGAGRASEVSGKPRS